MRDLGLADRVNFLHVVPNDDLPMLYNLADCFVYPSPTSRSGCRSSKPWRVAAR